MSFQICAKNIKSRFKVALENLCPNKATDVLEKILEIADKMIETLKETDINFPVLSEDMKTHSQFKDTDKFLNKAYLGAYDIASKI